jgi:hypothetical protein
MKEPHNKKPKEIKKSKKTNYKTPKIFRSVLRIKMDQITQLNQV